MNGEETGNRIQQAETGRSGEQNQTSVPGEQAEPSGPLPQKEQNLANLMEIVTEILELTVAVIVLVGFVISVIPLVKDMPGLLDNSNNYSFHVFLEHAFNLVIGIEFIRMLIKHTPGSTLGVLLFAIARHMVLDGSSGFELLMGVASIAGIFAIRKYLYVHSFESTRDYSTLSWFRKQGSKKDEKK